MTWLLIFLLALLPQSLADEHDADSDRVLLGKAIDYFQSGKFHESLLIFDKLDQRYELNPRFRAFMAVCYYYDWNDEKTCELLDELIPSLEPFAPHERSIYYYINAESHFNLKQYDRAIGYYDQALNVCYNNEKPDALYRIGYCYLFNNDEEKAYEYFKAALNDYRQYCNTPQDQPRMAQIERMLKGLEPDRKELQADQQMARDTIHWRIVNDIDLSDIYEQQMIVVDEDSLLENKSY